VKQRSFPKLSQQKMADFLAIKRERLAWASREGIVGREQDGSYRPETVTGQWLKYERGRHAKKSGRSEFDRQRVRLTKAKAEEVERRLAILDHSLLGTDDIVQTVKAVCLRIKSKLQAAIPRLAKACYHAPSLTEALFKTRGEFDLLISELSALEKDAAPTQFGVVADANGESNERPPAGKGSGDSAG
jgi:hypothetical protein